MAKHLFLTIDNNTTSIGNTLPKLSFPRMVYDQDEEFELAGYFVNYDKSFDVKKIFEEIKKRGFKDLVNSNSEFLLFLFNKKNKKMAVVTDQFGKFPCYFSPQKDQVLLSSSFSLLKSNIQNQGLSLDFDNLFASMIWDIYTTERTLLSEIKRIPSGCVAEFSVFNSKRFTVTSLVDLVGFLSTKGENYESTAEFAKDWLKTIGITTQDRLREIGRLKFTCDLSSGFDCTLVAYCLSRLAEKDFTCYSKHSPLANDETNLELMQKFATTHSLKLKTIDVSSFYTRDGNLQRLWRTSDLYQFSSTDQDHYFSKLHDNGVQIRFTGDGGDEIYASASMDILSRFPIQNSFIGNVSYFKKFGLERFFTRKAVNYALSSQRFNQRRIYPLIVSTSAAAVFWIEAEYYWEHDLYAMTPYMDTRLINLARRIPKVIKGTKQVKKMLTLKHLPQVFNEEMFREKAGLEVVFANFVRNQKGLISSFLANSVFAKIGWIDKDKIIKMLNDQTSELYTNGQFAIVLETMIKFEWFIQKNAVKY